MQKVNILHLSSLDQVQNQTKKNKKPIGIENIKTLTKDLNIPWFAIGGIRSNNISHLKRNGLKKIALVSQLMNSEDPKEEAIMILKELSHEIKVNGEEKKIELDQENALLSTALNLMGYKPNTIVVELNNLIINSIKWEKVKLKDGDSLEIVSIVGGG